MYHLFLKADLRIRTYAWIALFSGMSILLIFCVFPVTALAQDSIESPQSTPDDSFWNRKISPVKTLDPPTDATFPEDAAFPENEPSEEKADPLPLPLEPARDLPTQDVIPQDISTQKSAGTTSSNASSSLKKRGVWDFIPKMDGFFSPDKKESEKAVTAKSQVNIQVPDVPLDDIIPADAVGIIRFTNIQNFNQAGSILLNKLGLGAVGPLEWARFTTFGQAIPYLDRSRNAALIYMPYGVAGYLACVIPVTDYAGFVKTLGAADTSGKITPVKVPKGFLVTYKKGYAVLVEGSRAEMMSYFLQTRSRTDVRMVSTPAVKGTSVSLEITPSGVHHAVFLGRAALEDFAPAFSESIKKVTLQNPELDRAENYFLRAKNTLTWIEGNVLALRWDLSVTNKTTISCITLLPKEKSALKNSQYTILGMQPGMVHGVKPVDSEGNPLELNQAGELSGRRFLMPTYRPNFLEVAAEGRAPFIASTEMTPYDLANSALAAKQIQMMRVRHLECSFLIPADNEYLAQRWCFFLGVDDADAFIREMVIPNAKLVGSHIASDAGSEIGAKILEGMALRRQARQSGRTRPPRIPANPEEAAARGSVIGNTLGNLLGGQAGVKQALKKYNYRGYTLYVLDNVLYQRVMKHIREEHASEMTHTVTRDPNLPPPPFGSVIGSLLSGDQSTIMPRYAVTTDKDREITLLMEKNYVVQLDPQHLMIVCGDDRVLDAALDRWNYTRLPQYDPQMGFTHPRNVYGNSNEPRVTQPGSWQESWNDLCAYTESAQEHHIRGVGLINVPAGFAMAERIRNEFAPQSSPLRVFPVDAPDILLISTVSPQASHYYTVIPHKFGTSLFNFIMKAPKRNVNPK